MPLGNYSSEKLSRNKKDYYNQMFYVHHPLLEQIISAKLEKCLKYGQVRDMLKGKNFEKQPKLKVVQAPCVIGNCKTIEIRLNNHRKSINGYHSRMDTRPKTTNTVLRSRASEPKIRQKLENLMKYDDNFEQSLRPTLSSRRYIQGSKQSIN